MISRAGVRRLGAVLAIAAVLSACDRGRGPDESLATFSAEEIFQRGEYELETSRRATSSLRYFKEIERLYPYTEWSRRALIMQAYAHHRAREYEESRAAAQRFLDTYPRDEDAPYAAYLLALSFYDQVDEVGRDQGVTFQALQHLRRLIEEYPDSDYTRSAILKFELAFDHLAGKEMEIGRFYLQRGNYNAAVNRFRVVVEDFQTSTHTPEALHRLVESYLRLGLRDEAQTAAAILGYNFEANPFYQDSFRLLTRQGLEPEAQGESWLRTIYRQALRGDWV
ncbi:MAG: outer membrane protein assembly factor BamD [Rhodobacteraceae bacterium]|nr:MAG: outer membrane protein assembly factor BamD [Paracoccaceae bacterium]